MKTIKLKTISGLAHAGCERRDKMHHITPTNSIKCRHKYTYEDAKAKENPQKTEKIDEMTNKRRFCHLYGVSYSFESIPFSYGFRFA